VGQSQPKAHQKGGEQNYSLRYASEVGNARLDTSGVNTCFSALCTWRLKMIEFAISDVCQSSPALSSVPVS
jgi:hypothetical protein